MQGLSNISYLILSFTRVNRFTQVKLKTQVFRTKHALSICETSSQSVELFLGLRIGNSKHSLNNNG